MKLLLLVLAAVWIGHAEDSINLNGVELTIGMEQSTVLEKLRFGNELKDQSSASQGIYVWRVRSPLTGDEGSVQFLFGKLVGVNVHKGEAEGEAAAVIVNRLFSILKRAEEAGVKTSVHTGNEVETWDRWRNREITFFIGQRELQLRLYEPIGTPNGRNSRISLTELLIKSSPTPPPTGDSTVKLPRR